MSLDRARYEDDLASEIVIRWIEGGYEPPNIPLAYEEKKNTWYIVVVEYQNILELADEKGRIYASLKNKDQGDYYLVADISNISDYPVTDRQYFATEDIGPVLTKAFTVL